MVNTEFVALFQAAKRREEEALARFFSIGLEMALAAVRKRLRLEDRALLESADLQQSVMVLLHAKLPGLSFDHQGAMGVWIGNVAENLVREARRGIRRRKRDPARIEPWPRDDLAAPVAHTISSVIDRREKVLKLLAMLDPNQAKVVRLRALEERSFPEIAEVLGISSEAARKRWCRAVADLTMRADATETAALAPTWTSAQKSRQSGHSDHPPHSIAPRKVPARTGGDDRGAERARAREGIPPS